ncbi:AAA family ATPase [Alteromonas macleodii]|uniref:AAA family ATPase n=1 Tax=Alteromonas macleodii TaxID=28108 RepID=UPI00027E63C2|nr:AAA family ATPase [Alteromonas macleodii]AFS39192.1 transposon Tn7 transposition protein TnsC [Alteromonas macleodii ATCC 27126]
MKTTQTSVTASYSDPGLAEYRGNPLIEALPQICVDDIALAKALASRPAHSEAELNMHANLRIHAIAKLMDGDFFHPLPSHLNLEKKLSLMIRSGYVKRNPAKNLDKEVIQENYLKTQGKEATINVFPTTDRSVQSTTLIGCSGSGKTTAVKKILSTYPQLIEHPKYNMHQQLTYVFVECPSNGDLASLCSNFFHAVDEVLGTVYHRRYTQKIRIGEKTLLQAMKQIAVDHSIGVLVIDEIQHLQDTKEKRDFLINFFTELTNTLGIPVLVVGTPKATGISKDLRGARREIGFGSMHWGISKTEKDLDRWRGFVRRLWRFQWVQKRTKKPSEDILTHLFVLSQGILDITVKIFVIAQIRAIVSGAEELTIPLLDTVYKEEMKSVHPMLDALRSGRVSEIEKYSDLTLPTVDVDSIVEELYENVEQELEENISEVEDTELKSLLKIFGLDFKDYATEIALLKDEYPDIDNTVLARKLAAQIETSSQSLKSIRAKEATSESKVVPFRKWSKLAHDDLRYIHSQSKTTSELHKSLVEKDLIIKV